LVLLVAPSRVSCEYLAKPGTLKSQLGLQLLDPALDPLGVAGTVDDRASPCRRRRAGRGRAARASCSRYEGVESARTNEVVGKVNETLVPQLRELPGFAGLLPDRGRHGVLSSLGLFETSEQAEESGKLASKWINDEHFSAVIPSAPKITNETVDARSNGSTSRSSTTLKVTRGAG
jgi:hypothetical protein